MAHEGRTALYTIFGTLIVFKLVMALWILSLQPSFHGAAFLVLTNVAWIALLAIPLLIGVVFWYRRIRVRAKRHQLVRAEWHVEEREPTGGRSR